MSDRTKTEMNQDPEEFLAEKVEEFHAMLKGEEAAPATVSETEGGETTSSNAGTAADKGDPPEERRCVHLFPDGRRCRNRRWRGKEFCYHHDPEAKGLRQEVAEETRRSSLRIVTATEVHELLGRTMEKVAAGKIPVGRAYAIGYLSQLLLRNLEAVEEEFRQVDLDEELAEEAGLRIQEVDAGEFFAEEDEEKEGGGEVAVSERPGGAGGPLPS